MTVRTDFTFNMEVSPRIVTIASPSVEATVQDIHDTITNYEDSVQGGQFPRLILSAGKEDLGGGVTVGITSTLQDAQIQFEGRTSPVESGAVSTNDTTGTLLNAVGGLFVTNAVERGQTVFNNVTGSMATVLVVTDENNLISQVLDGGARTTWLNTDTYSIYPNTQCNVSGGNLVAVDANGDPLSSILQSPNTNVVRTASSSATLANQEQLEASLYFKGVAVDAVNPASVASSDDLAGTLATPCTNDTFGAAVASARNLHDFFLIGTNVISADHSGGQTFTGADALKSITVVTAGADVSNCTFINMILTGTVDGNILVSDAVASNLIGATGIIKETGISGTLTLGNVGNGGVTSLSDVSAISPGATIDAAAAASIVNGDGIRGIYTLTNKTGAEVFNLNFSSGELTIDTTCTTGTINVYGHCTITDNSGAGCTVNDLTDESILSDIHKANYNRRKHDTVANTITIYEADNVTPYKVFDADDALTDITPQ